MSKIYKIPILWESIKTYEVEADTLQEAVEKSLSIFLKDPDENYLQDSFSIDEIISDDYPDEDYDTHEAIKKVFL